MNWFGGYLKVYDELERLQFTMSCSFPKAQQLLDELRAIHGKAIVHHAVYEPSSLCMKPTVEE